MAKLVLMCGCSGAGKTTFAKEYAKKHGLLYLGIDDFYKKVNGDECLHINSFEVWIEYYKAIHEAEINNIGCIIDTNALTISQRDQFIEWFPSFEHHIIAIEASPKLRNTNNRCRRRQVPQSRMDEMALKYTRPHPLYDRPEWLSMQVIQNEENHFSSPLYMKGTSYDSN